MALLAMPAVVESLWSGIEEYHFATADQSRIEDAVAPDKDNFFVSGTADQVPSLITSASRRSIGLEKPKAVKLERTRNLTITSSKLIIAPLATWTSGKADLIFSHFDTLLFGMKITEEGSKVNDTSASSAP